MTEPPREVAGLPVAEIARRVKVELRDRMRRIRRAMGERARAEKSARITERVVALEAWSAARTVMLFVPMRTEIDATLLEHIARTDGKDVLGPRMTEDGRDLEVRRWEAGVAPVESGRMVREPPASAPFVPEESVDFVLVPALALDPTGGRLGFGAGLYDSLLRRLTRATRVGVAFDFQLLAEVPKTEGDEPVHFVVTESRTLEVARAATGTHERRDR